MEAIVKNEFLEEEEPEVEENQEEAKSFIVQTIKKNLWEKNKNYLGVFCGATGSGKSYSAIAFAKEIDPNFDIQKRIVFNSREFVKLLNSETLKKGDAIIWDDAGVGIPAREWYTESNRLISYITQVFRTLNLAVIFTVPSFNFIDVNIRKLFHAYVETQFIDFGNNLCVLSYKEIQYNPILDKMYFKYPRINGQAINPITVKKPARRDCILYERVRNELVNKLKEDAEVQFNPPKEVEKRPRCKHCTSQSMRTSRTGRFCLNCGYVDKSIKIGWNLPR